MLHAPKQLLAQGDRAPNFVLPDHEGKFRMFYDRVTGRPLVILFTGVVSPANLPAPLTALQAAAERFDALGVDLFCIGPAANPAIRMMLPRLNLWADPERKITEALLGQAGYGGQAGLAGGAVVALALDANQRLLAAFRSAGADLADSVLDVYARRPAQPAPVVRRQSAPVLLMPDLLDREMSASLIGLFESGKVEEGAVGSVLSGKEGERVHHQLKKRLDYKVEDPQMHATLQNVLGRRIAPEVDKAFNFRGFKFDRFLVCRYAADREDRFRTHRDNVSPATADRRFAMTLNLNGDEYEGGELVFPEYGPDRYKPGNGGAVIFSCSLLHEALPVTTGVRFALLTFLRSPTPPPGAKSR